MNKKPTFGELEQRVLELEKREKSYRLLFDRMNSGFARHGIIVGENGKPIDYVFLEINSAFETLTGFNRDDILYKTFTEVFSGAEKDQSDWIEKFGQVALTGRELTLAHFSQSLGKWYSVRAFRFEKNQIITIFEDVTDHRRVEEALRKTSENLQAILDNSPLLISEFDLEGRYIRVNRAVTNLFERPSSELIGKTFSEILTEDIAELFMKRIETVSNTRNPVTVDDHLVTSEGAQYFITTVFPLFDASGQIRSIGAIAHNISERKLKEEALKEKEALLDRSQEIAAMGSFTWDLRSDSLVWSKSMYAIHGLTEASFAENLTKVFNQLIHPDDQDRIRMEIEKMVKAGSVWDMEFRIVRPDGEERIMRSSGEFELDESGNPIKCLGIHQDITERKRAELALRHEQEKFRTLLENIVDWVWMVDTSGRYTYVSPQAKEILGYEVDEILGKTPFDFMSSDEVQRVAPVFSEAVEKRERIFSLEDTLLAKDGSEVIFETNATPLFGQEDDMIGFMGTCRDITERKKAENKLSESESRFRSFVENANDIVYSLSPEGRFTYISPNWPDFMGESAEEAIGKSFEP